jgi:hypothetical protein
MHNLVLFELFCKGGFFGQLYLHFWFVVLQALGGDAAKAAQNPSW